MSATDSVKPRQPNYTQPVDRGYECSTTVQKVISLVLGLLLLGGIVTAVLGGLRQIPFYTLYVGCSVVAASLILSLILPCFSKKEIKESHEEIPDTSPVPISTPQVVVPQVTVPSTTPSPILRETPQVNHENNVDQLKDAFKLAYTQNNKEQEAEVLKKIQFTYHDKKQCNFEQWLEKLKIKEQCMTLMFKSSEGMYDSLAARYLWLAISLKEHSIIELLLKLGVDPNHENREGHSFVAIAILKVTADILQMLLNAGGNFPTDFLPKTTQESQQKVYLAALCAEHRISNSHIKGLFERGIHYAVENKLNMLIELLHDFGYPLTPDCLNCAAKSGNFEALETLLKKGVRPNLNFLALTKIHELSQWIELIAKLDVTTRQGLLNCYRIGGQSVETFLQSDKLNQSQLQKLYPFQLALATSLPQLKAFAQQWVSFLDKEQLKSVRAAWKKNYPQETLPFPLQDKELYLKEICALHGLDQHAAGLFSRGIDYALFHTLNLFLEPLYHLGYTVPRHALNFAASKSNFEAVEILLKLGCNPGPNFSKFLKESDFNKWVDLFFTLDTTVKERIVKLQNSLDKIPPYQLALATQFPELNQKILHGASYLPYEQFKWVFAFWEKMYSQETFFKTFRDNQLGCLRVFPLLQSQTKLYFLEEIVKELPKKEAITWKGLCDWWLSQEENQEIVEKAKPLQTKLKELCK